MSHFTPLCLATLLAALAAPAWSAPTLLLGGAGSYNLGSPTSAGATPASTTSCGAGGIGQDALDFQGADGNNIGLHAYACGGYDNNYVDFGSRASGENTYFVQGIASVIGALTTSEGNGFSFYINPGEIGAFGSTLFSGGEFQKAKLTIQLTIDGKKYLDEAWSADVTDGVVSHQFVSGADADVALSVGYTENSGAGYFSYGLSGGWYNIALTDGDHDISYVMTSEASGWVSSTSVCTAYLQGNGRQAARGDGVEVPAEGPPTGEAFTSYCGAGARSGDPFPSNDPGLYFEPIARAQVLELPEPMSAGLALVALFAAGSASRRRAIKR